ncbi:MAG: stalk domain-containing protein [Caldisericia bacterium]|nr:stalk domain-containing protein [Caldisericia bacterium]MDD4614535.1 stalk domain-containing protein [Caldisericia bacterium]
MKKLISTLLGLALAVGSLVVPFPIQSTQAIVKKMVLVEQFTATWCGPCVKGSETIDALYEKYGNKDFILIKHHPDTRGDSMLNKFSQLRANKLSISGYPSFYIDTKLCSDRSTDALTSDIKNAKSKGAKSSISIDKSTIGDTSVTFQIEYEDVPDNSEIWYCLVEDFVYVKAQNGEKRHRFISRDGGTLPGISGSGSTSVTIDMKPTWSTEMIRVYAWIESRIGIDNSDYYDFGNGDINPLGSVLASYPNQLDFGQMKPDSTAKADLHIRNCGTQDGSVDISIDESYVSLKKTLNIPYLSETIYSVSISTNGLEPGLYRGTINLKGVAYSKEVPFQLQVLHHPKITIDTNTIDFGEVKRGKSDSETIHISNAHDGVLTGTTSASEDWLRTNPRTFSENSFDLKVSISTSKLKSGSYTGTVLIESDGGNKEIAVRVTIIAADIIMDTEEFNFGNLTLKQAKKIEEALTISNEGDATASIHIANIPTFIVMEKKDFSLESGEKRVLPITLDTSVLSIGTYNESIIFEFDSESVSIPVAFEIIEEPAIIRVESDFINEDGILYVEAEEEKIDIECVIYNDGEARMDGSIEFDTQWLRPSDRSFAVLGGRKKTITLTFDPSKADDTENSGKIVFTSNGGNVELDILFVTTKESVVIQFQIGNKTVKINDQPVLMDAAPFILNGRTVVPIRIIAEAFGATIEWEGSTQTITILLKEKTIVMKIGSTIAQINDNPMILDAPPTIQNGRTFVPLRFIAEAFGATIEWEGSTQTITITL